MEKLLKKKLKQDNFSFKSQELKTIYSVSVCRFLTLDYYFSLSNLKDADFNQTVLGE